MRNSSAAPEPPVRNRSLSGHFACSSDGDSNLHKQFLLIKTSTHLDCRQKKLKYIYIYVYIRISEAAGTLTNFHKARTPDKHLCESAHSSEPSGSALSRIRPLKKHHSSKARTHARTHDRAAEFHPRYVVCSGL